MTNRLRFLRDLFAIVLALGVSPVDALPSFVINETCEHIGTHARTVMLGRQNGVSKEDMEKMIADTVPSWRLRSLFEQIVREAQSIPVEKKDFKDDFLAKLDASTRETKALNFGLVWQMRCMAFLQLYE